MEWHSSVQHMIGELKNRMEYFEGELQKNHTTQAPNISSLAAEYASFKEFTMNTLRALQSQIELTARSIDQLEMRGRRKILLLHGVPEEQNENTAAVVMRVVTGNLKVQQLSRDDISRCHRMGRSSSNRPRPILFKLRDVVVRDKIWFAKTNLKNSGITLSEFLTKARHEVFMKARQCFGVTKCWTREGNVYVVGPDGDRHRINWLGDLNAIAGQPQPKVAAATVSPRPHVASPSQQTATASAAKETVAAAPKARRAVTSRK